MKCWSSSLLVHLKYFIPKRNTSTYLQKKVLLETHYATCQTYSWTLSQCGYFISIYVKLTYILALDLLSLLRVDVSFLKRWISRFGMNDTLHWQSTDVYSSPCVCVYSHWHSLKEFVFVDWISISVCEYVCGSHLNKAYSQLQQQIHQP